MKNYTKVDSKFIEDINAKVTIYKHDKTGARICTMENDDTNKVFSIAFRTPAINSTGLTHILEHSVLCGSKNYPVKDPFVELIKGSLNTFLNAFTFPDKTMYPCASENDKDFKNLMSVYMDAVFYPNIYKHEEIFMQEGWHYEIFDKNDPICYNGVVYNEMKGAFSSPDDVLARACLNSLFKDTTYKYESGGDPLNIPDLTYEQFLDFHKKYYNPSNSYIYIYGNCDMEERMKWLDEAYLSKFDRVEFDTKVLYQTPYDKTFYDTYYYPVGEEEDMSNKTTLAYNIALPTTLDIKLCIAMSMIKTVILDNQKAVLKQALLDANLGKNILGSFDTGTLQPVFSIIAKDTSEENAHAFEDKINEVLKEIVKNGLPKDSLYALINYSEFKSREQKMDGPKGLIFQMAALESYLYDEDKPFAKLEDLKYYDELRKDVENGYFEEIIEKYLISNTHKSLIKLMPSNSISVEKEKALTEKLSKYKASLSDEEIDKLIEKNKALKEYQQTPSTEEEIKTLPTLELSDIPSEPEKYNSQVVEKEFKIYYQDYFTNHINYVDYMFDISDVDFKDASYIQLLVSLYGKLNTTKHNVIELDNLIKANTGGISSFIRSFVDLKKEFKAYITFSYSCINNKCDFTSSLVDDILHSTSFDDEKRLYEILCQIKGGLEMSAAGRGHMLGITRAASYQDAGWKFKDLTNGIGYLDFISDLVKNFDTKKKEIIQNLNNYAKAFYNKSSFSVVFTGHKDDFASVYKNALDMYSSLDDNRSYKANFKFEPNILNEGIKTEFDVNFACLYSTFGKKFENTGAIYVFNNVVGMDYLWMKVRVNGGAYGCFINTTELGDVILASYRDPKLKETYEVYEGILSYIDSFDATFDEMLKFKIGAIASSSEVLHNSSKGTRAALERLQGITFELKKQRREELLNASVLDIRNLKKLFEEAFKNKSICTVGSKNMIEANKVLFNSTRPLFK